MSAFVTGATGFIGRHLLEELLRNREGEVHVLVREGSLARFGELVERWQAAVPEADVRRRVRPVVGDLREPLLGVSPVEVYDAVRTVGRLPVLRRVRSGALGALGIPVEAVEHADLPARYDTAQADRALAGSGISVPPLETYVDRLWAYWRRELAS